MVGVVIGGRIEGDRGRGGEEKEADVDAKNRERRIEVSSEQRKAWDGMT
jgi:hypothetical protein